MTDLDRLLRADIAHGREALRRLLRGGSIRLVPGADRIHTAEAEVLPFGLLLAPGNANAASVSRNGARYTTVDCGGPHSDLYHLVELNMEVRVAV